LRRQLSPIAVKATFDRSSDSVPTDAKSPISKDADTQNAEQPASAVNGDGAHWVVHMPFLQQLHAEADEETCDGADEDGSVSADKA
jgi:hypothetical protein